MKFPRILAAMGAALVLSPAVFAQAPPQAAPQPPLTQQQINEEMLKELKAIHQILEKLATPQPPAPQGPPQPASATITNLKGFLMGRPDAPLTMIEFTDLQCPYCRQYVTTTFDEIKKNWIDTGKLRYISRDFPLDSIHPYAIGAARASRCAADQGKFWEMRHTILVNNAAATSRSTSIRRRCPRRAPRAAPANRGSSGRCA
jgi:protein-disulfide isomerase